MRFIVSLGPGSGADIGARLLADRLTAKWKQPVVVENRPGGDAVVAITAFIGAKDDHTLLYTPTSSFTAHPFQHARLAYDPARARSGGEGIEHHRRPCRPRIVEKQDGRGRHCAVKAEPGKLNFTTATGMTDFIFDGYFKTSGLNITRVPYKDTVQALTDLGEGRVQAYVGALAIVQPHVQAGRAR